MNKTSSPKFEIIAKSSDTEQKFLVSKEEFESIERVLFGVRK